LTGLKFTLPAERGAKARFAVFFDIKALQSKEAK